MQFLRLQEMLQGALLAFVKVALAHISMTVIVVEAQFSITVKLRYM